MEQGSGASPRFMLANLQRSLGGKGCRRYFSHLIKPKFKNGAYPPKEGNPPPQPFQTLMERPPLPSGGLSQTQGTPSQASLSREKELWKRLFGKLSLLSFGHLENGPRMSDAVGFKRPGQTGPLGGPGPTKFGREKFQGVHGRVHSGFNVRW
ncbi:hypothetical protein JTE90_000306 [Oedothorax gibbosus]|uniref:Uncharacterized protein n=1 Tax=Oedothorax gibbosus TaxID=931172 RepID=A0AAV6VT57_9ARAC|nr:hypothetical protein JTE90_000306 [Oedothorax gibbosus]